jgi:predicted nucleic acid-binding protein
MALVSGAFFDTSVLLAGLIELGPAPAAAHRLLDAVAARKLPRPQTAWHCCLELYAVATRLPEEYRLSAADALTLIEAEVLGRFAIHDLPRSRRAALLSDCSRAGVVGGRIYDAHIAEVARAAGARLVITENRRHFTSLQQRGIRVLSVSEALEGLRS